jgi:two-component system response regulator GlrR
MPSERTIAIVGEEPPSEVVAIITSIASNAGLRLSSQTRGIEALPESTEGILFYSPTHTPSPEMLRLSLDHRPPFIVIVTPIGSTENLHCIDPEIYNNVIVKWSTVETLPEVFRAVVDTMKFQRTEHLRQKLVREFGLRQLVGQSPIFQDVLLMLPKLASSNSPVLISGETGTGKEACARAIHYLGERSGRAFIPINCSAIPDHLFENEFFGHKRGAFTDAHYDEPGILSQSRGGTLFLDEITSLPLPSQAKILRLFEEGSFRPLGAQMNVDVNVRFIAATNLNVRDEVDGGRFRKDLLYRVNVLRIEIPALRDRGRDEIEELARYFIHESAAANGKVALDLSAEALEKLQRYHWPGNVRELKNVIERAVVMTDANLIGPNVLDCGGRDREFSGGQSFKAARRKAIEQFEREMIESGFARCGHNISRLSKQLSLDRRTLQRLLQKYQIPTLTGVR